MLPQVDIERPHVVHFLMSEFVYVMQKMHVVSIDMKKMTVVSSFQYTNGEEALGTEDADFVRNKSSSPMPFLPCEFSKFLDIAKVIILC
jgi:hypothetical protein